MTSIYFLINIITSSFLIGPYTQSGAPFGFPFSRFLGSWEVTLFVHLFHITFFASCAHFFTLCILRFTHFSCYAFHVWCTLFHITLFTSHAPFFKLHIFHIMPFMSRAFFNVTLFTSPTPSFMLHIFHVTPFASCIPFLCFTLRSHTPFSYLFSMFQFFASCIPLRLAHLFHGTLFVSHKPFFMLCIFHITPHVSCIFFTLHFPHLLYLFLKSHIFQVTPFTAQAFYSR